MKISEAQLVKKLKPEILRGRDGDWEHCQRVVKWVKELAKDKDDLFILITTGYIHDIGWRDVIPPQKLTLERLKKFEPIANANTEPYITDFLSKLDYDKEDIKKVIRIVKAMDTYESNEEDEAILVDSDSLSKLCIEHIQQKFQPDEWQNMFKFFKRESPKRIKTKKGKEIYPKLLDGLEEELKSVL